MSPLKAFGTMQGKRQHLKVAKACGKKVAKLENQSVKRQQVQEQQQQQLQQQQQTIQQQKIIKFPRTQVVTTTMATTAANQTIFYRNEAQIAVEALNEISFR